MLEKLRNRMNQVSEAAIKMATEFEEATRCPEEIRNQRFNICESCEHLFKPTASCKKCGCFMKIKTWIGPARCPIGKWEAIEIKNTSEL